MHKITTLNIVDARIHCIDCGEFLTYPVDYLHLWRPFQEIAFEEAVRDHV